MDVRVSLTTEEIKTAIRDYILKQGMSLLVKEVEFASGGAAVVICEKAKPVSTYYQDR